MVKHAGISRVSGQAKSGFVLRRKKEPPKLKRRDVLGRGIRRLRLARGVLLARQMANMDSLIKRQEELLHKKRLSRADSKELHGIMRRIKAVRWNLFAIEEKAGYLLNPRLAQTELALQIDPDFPELLHHKSFSELMHTMLNRRGNHLLGMIDIDKLKEINSRFGSHWWGNRALQLYSESIAELCRSKGTYYLDNFGANNPTIGCKYGGDEFVFYFPFPPKRAGEIIKDFREILFKKISKSEFVSKQKLSQKQAFELLGFSGGVLAFSGAIKGSEEYAGLFRQISSMTLRAKEHGRNRVFLETIRQKTL